MSWLDLYREKLLTADEAVRLIQSGDRVYYGGNAAIPMGLIRALADRYEPKRAGHPLRIAAYIVHPIGVLIDYLILRPAHWVGDREPFTTIFGHEDY